MNKQTCSYQLEFANLSLGGFKSINVSKSNQDYYLCIKDFDVIKEDNGKTDCAFFGVFDGHGVYGHRCSKFVANEVYYYYIVTKNIKRTNIL